MIIKKKEDAENLISKCEGIKLLAYLDLNKVPTIGIGTIKYPDGNCVKIGDFCTEEQAKIWLRYHLESFVYPKVEILQLKYKFNDKIFSSLCSLAYNIGSCLAGKSILYALKNGNFLDLCEAFRKYVLVNGIQSKGLKNRREIEIKFMT